MLGHRINGKAGHREEILRLEEDIQTCGDVLTVIRTYEMFPILAGILEMLCQCRDTSRLRSSERGLHGMSA